MFADPEARSALEALIHPGVRRATDEWFATLDADRYSYAIADIPLLYEVGRDVDFDAVIVAACDPDTQVQRAMTRDGVSEANARQRIAAQLPVAQKVSRADYVVRTDGTYEDTKRQVKALFERLRS